MNHPKGKPGGIEDYRASLRAAYRKDWHMAVKKVWEEEWTVAWDVLNFPDGKWGRTNADAVSVSDDTDEARAKLAAEEEAVIRTELRDAGVLP